MQFSKIAMFSLFAFALALPHPQELRRRDDLCPGGLYGVPQCCATDVLGVADLDCGQPPYTPDNNADFKIACEQDSKQAMCCVIPLASLGVLCTGV
ncbi:Fungal hydrophobin [Orbilia ellipsospora]|uniref:Fungal hydrophobin n=1 Tax=Orbilia ellipsospora TaxID=2528407 RepID=A0AAV9X3V9_9PEZI